MASNTEAKQATPTWKSLETLIAVFAIAMITLHLVLRCGTSSSPTIVALPLLGVLVLGGIPLVWDLLLKMFRREFGSDLLAGISIVTSVLLGEYLAGSLVVLMLSGGEALEAYAVSSASSVLRALSKRMPAVAHRRIGSTVEDVPLAEAAAAGGALERLLAALRAVPAPPDAAVVWHEPEATAGLTWRACLRGGLRDQPDAMVSGWRQRLSKNRRIEAIFSACTSRIEKLLPYCPERRDLVHGDLLHQNVLISEDATRVTAIFSWKCSLRGDFLYDTAWCTFWGPWHPGIAAADLWGRTIRAPDLSETDLIDAPLRHHCYELQIAASHFGWNVWTGNEEALAAVAAAAELILDRGPLPMPLNHSPRLPGE